MFVAPGDEVYEGMVVGEHVRGEDLDINIVREKQLNNIRSSTAEELVRLSPPKPVTLDAALEFLQEDEAVEVTPDNVRLRKADLLQVERVKASRQKRAAAKS